MSPAKKLRQEWDLMIGSAITWAMLTVLAIALVLALASMVGCRSGSVLQPDDRQYELSAIPCDDDNCGKKP